jgi:hypothetical protein
MVCPVWRVVVQQMGGSLVNFCPRQFKISRRPFFEG